MKLIIALALIATSCYTPTAEAQHTGAGSESNGIGVQLRPTG